MTLTYCEWCGDVIAKPRESLDKRMQAYLDHVREEHPEKAEPEPIAALDDEDEDGQSAAAALVEDKAEAEASWPKEFTFYAHGGKKTESHYDLAEDHADEGSDLYDELRYLANEIELTYRLHEDGRLDLVRVFERAGYGRDNREIDIRDDE